MNDLMKIILFTLDHQGYAMPLSSVIKILRAVEVTAVPSLPPFLLGIINIRGEVTPVLDIRKLLGLAAKPMSLSDQLVVTQVHTQSCILVVDAVNEIQTIDSSLATSINKEGQLIMLVDLESLLSDSDIDLMEKIANHGSKIT